MILLLPKQSFGWQTKAIISIVITIVATWLTLRGWIEWCWFNQFELSSILWKRWLLHWAGAYIGLSIGIALQYWLGLLWTPTKRQETSSIINPLVYGVILFFIGVNSISPLILLATIARRLLQNPFYPRRLHGLFFLQEISQPLALLLFCSGMLLLLLKPRASARLLNSITSVLITIILSRGWSLWIPAFMATPVGEWDPVFGADLSFTLLRFPALALILTIFITLASQVISAGLWGIIAQPTHLSEGFFTGLQGKQIQILRWPLSIMLGLVGAGFWLARHQLLLSTSGSVQGAGWLDLHLTLPFRTLGAVINLLLACIFFSQLKHQSWRAFLRNKVSFLILLPGVLEIILTPALQILLVKPQELELETPYLDRSIRATRRAFQLDRIHITNINPKSRLTQKDVNLGQTTLHNMRLWDTQTLLATNRQLQQLRLYYRFSEPAVDRYDLKSSNLNGRQQVIIAAREMDQNSLPTRSRTWLNRHLVFTHGYGFTLSPANTSGVDGLPEYFISDLGTSTKVEGNKQLKISRNQLSQLIPIGQPSLYFGALTSPYAIAPTKVREFDYPQGDVNFYTHYFGNAGIAIGGFWSRFAASLYLYEPKLLTQGSLNSETRLLIRREVRQRLRALAPFLRFDAKPYLVSVHIKGDPLFLENQYQYWIVDGFTISRSYAYSAPLPGDENIRYLRNSVKAIIDAYNGNARLYINELYDPVLASWRKIFPELFQPLKVMPENLQTHLMYPRHMFELQADQLLRYHVIDPRIFYSGDDVWQVPKELYGHKQVPMEAYHISAQLSSSCNSEFLLLQPLTPLARPSLTGWLAARSDDPHYGELVLLRFPSQTSIYGPEQIQALINQDPVISQQFSLWDRAGSEVIQGNLLVVPVGNALLYVEPIYLRARNGGLPTLTQVVISDGNHIAMAENLEKGIQILLNL
uniref:Uncharacterized protein n=1 Tax=Paulinella chromatophora TaxID=39717 RepID=B1X5P6_PAUCH|nr:hypothetical protein PCC_0855 [Paulinella chromatophora]ACB43265.1 hypothetical protein PCC_0855 [Paulinella chromatophora]